MAKRKSKTTVAVTVDDSNRAWISNYPPLKDWLNKHEARCMWQLPMQQPNSSTGEYEYDFGPTAYVECWLVYRRPVIIVVHANKNGWEIYSALDDLKISATLADVERRVGFTPEHGVSNDLANMARTLAQTIIDRTHSEDECNTPEDAEELAKLVLGMKS